MNTVILIIALLTKNLLADSSALAKEIESSH